MNLADSERMAGVLESLGYSCAVDISDADVLVYNTCSIREKAENKLYSALGKQVARPLCCHTVGAAHSSRMGGCGGADAGEQWRTESHPS